MTVYGTYSMGSGAILDDPGSLFAEIDDASVIESYERTILNDLARCGLQRKDLSTMAVCDVGTGRQALAFALLGANAVDHYDLSAANVARTACAIERRGLTNITTRQADLVEQRLPEGKYDFVYLHGIVQHFADTVRGLANCLCSLKPGGIVWLYFYRSGTFFHFVVEYLRELARAMNVREAFELASVRTAGMKAGPYYLSGLMDNLFVQHIRLFEPREYLDFLELAGFDVFNSSRLEPRGRAVGHGDLHESVILMARRTGETKDYDFLVGSRMFSDPRRQLSPSLYAGSREEQNILTTLETFERLERNLRKRDDVVRFSAAMEIYLALETYIRELPGPDRHEGLRNFIERLEAHMSLAELVP